MRRTSDDGMNPKVTATRERPILFSGPMVRAIMAGRKTQTRRLVHERMYLIVDGDEDTGRVIEQSDADFGALATEHARCPYGQPGDRLWVRETWARLAGNGRVVFRDDVPQDRRPKMKWQPSIFMPRQISRITLEVSGARVERLLDISEDDARAEGVDVKHIGSFSHPYLGGRVDGRPAAHSYFVLWDEINGKRAACETNPWVWVISFRRVDAVDGGPKFTIEPEEKAKP